MKTFTILIIGLAAVLIFGGAVFGYTRLTQQAQTDAMMKTETSMMQPEDEVATMSDDDMMLLTLEEQMVENAEKGLYKEFIPGLLESTIHPRRVLFFYANWCPTCQPADKSFAENMEKLPMDTAVIRVNYNDSDTDAAEKELAQKYGVTYQHTFVQIDRDGNEITKWNGGNIDTLLKNLE